MLAAATGRRNGSQVVLSLVPSLTPLDKGLDTMSGALDYIVLVASPAARFRQQPNLRILNKKDHVLFVAEVKGPDAIDEHVPQTIAEMAACARTVGKKTIRGVLSNGCKWIFLILTLNEDGDGGGYVASEAASILVGFSEVSKEMVSLVAGILAHWVVHSHDPLNADEDFFDIVSFV
ncbi:hypothetical protein NMY22_g2134 [Coprinellus aureogranulatus]|nr:hypothetical protein NMY22_g2134 [Coprinellus aureogranulatus]